MGADHNITDTQFTSRWKYNFAILKDKTDKSMDNCSNKRAKGIIFYSFFPLGDTKRGSKYNCTYGKMKAHI